MKKIAIFTCISLLSSISFGQSMSSMTKPQITDMLSDQTITTVPLVTINDKLVDNKASIYFSKDGKLIGKFDTKPDSDPQNDLGKWEVKSAGTLCATWDHWNENKPICVDGYNVKNALVFVNNDTHKLETLVLQENIKSGNQVS